MILSFRKASAVISSYRLVYAFPDPKCPWDARDYEIVLILLQKLLI